jgi:hypothetical protein
VHDDAVADPCVQRRDDERLPVDDEAEVADQGRVEDLVYRGALVRRPLRQAPDAVALRFPQLAIASRFALWHDGTVAHAGRPSEERSGASDSALV